MIHAFMLVVLIGDVQQPSPMYFKSIDVCQYYAKRIPRKYGYVGGGNTKITAWCKPVYVQDGPNIYDH
mgnify:CR=1 FL=1